ncbi:MAG: OB-fold putative lipoprotein [Flavobacteriales bacterium]|nr:OB-fold putative lipoprotein [Flavobacteriales bacterium]
MKKIILLLVLAGVAIGAWYAYSEWNRKPATAADAATDFKVTAVDLMNEFNADETAATKKYLEKMLEVKGIVAEVSPNDKNYDVLLETDDLMGGVNCHLVPEQSEKAKSLHPGDEITVKGKCNGKLTDIELNVGIILD